MSPITYFSFSHTPASKASRRCPLTPPAVSAPSIAPYSSAPAMHRSYSSPKATTLLTRVALTSRANSNSGSPPSSPQEKTLGEQAAEQAYQTYAEKALAREPKGDDWRYWRDISQRDGYISFPDFERYCPQHESSQEQNQNEQRQQQTVRT
jgi:hypothetical protein